MRQGCAWLWLLLCVAVLAGCEKALFPQDTPRSPYERYQTLRGQSRPATTANAIGVEEPAIRERLRPLGEP